jgi:hypothetical protein
MLNINLNCQIFHIKWIWWLHVNNTGMWYCSSTSNPNNVHVVVFQMHSTNWNLINCRFVLFLSISRLLYKNNDKYVFSFSNIIDSIVIDCQHISNHIDRNKAYSFIQTIVTNCNVLIEGWDPIYRFNPAILLCLSQARNRISNVICCGLSVLFGA